jgi:putative transposase
MIFQKYGNMKFAYRNREFWCRGYYVDTVGKNTKMIKEYIDNQIKTVKETDQLSLFDPRDPFKKGKQVIDATLTGLHKHTCMQQIERGLGPKK